MVSFWDDSRNKIDTARLSKYIESFDMMPDKITDFLISCGAKKVCDAGCGCGIYSLKLAIFGFDVSGFDISDKAVEVAKQLLKISSVKADLKTAGIVSTAYCDNCFDAVVSRDVIDHISKEDAAHALRELCRITKPGGNIIITLDRADGEYEAEPHTVNSDGDYIYTDGKWSGMFFHPYSEREIDEIIPKGTESVIETCDNGITVRITKPSR